MEPFFENEVVKRFEEMIENNEETFFDTDEYEEIVSYYLEIGDFQYAELAINKALKLYPDSVNLKIKELDLFVERNDFRQAKKRINDLEGIAKDDLEFLITCAKYYSNMGNPHKAIDLCKKALEKDDEDQAYLNNFIADEYQNIDNPFSALKHYKKALASDPQDDYALENIMFCYSDLNKNEEALRFINQYLDQYPYSETAWFEYANLHFNRRDYEEAIKGFDFLLAINPSIISVYSHKSACYEALEDWKKAIETYKESQEYEFTKSYSFYKIGQCYQKMKSPVEALKAFQQALHEDPQFYPVMISISEVYESLGNLPQALHFAKEASRYAENDVELQKKMAFLFISLGKIEQALLCLRRMVDLDSKSFFNWYTYVEVLMLAENYVYATTIISAALKQHRRAELFYQLSNCYFHLNNAKEARAALNKAIKMDASLLEDMQVKYPDIDREIKELKTKK